MLIIILFNYQGERTRYPILFGGGLTCYRENHDHDAVFSLRLGFRRNVLCYFNLYTFYY
jgi:hypothetical protein